MLQNINIANTKYLLLTLLLLCFLAYLPQKLLAQRRVTEGDMLNGEVVVDDAYIPGGYIVVTGNNLYAAEIANNSTLGASHGYLYDKLWSPPPSRKIVRIGNKSKQLIDVKGNTIGSEDTKYEVVMLDNGDVYKLYIDHADISGQLFFPRVETESYYGHVGGTGSEGYFKVLGDALFALSSSHLYVSTDSAVWRVDSAGLAGAHVNDVVLDSIQDVYVATDKGLFMQDTALHVFEKITSYTGGQNVTRVFIDRKKRVLIGLNGGGIYVSNNKGSSWQIDTAGIGNVEPSVFTDDKHGNIFFTGNGHVYRSLSGTQPWQIIDSSIYRIAGTEPSINTLSTVDSAIIAGTSFGTFLSIDSGKTWVQDNAGIQPEYISGLARYKGHSLVSTSLGIFKTGVNDSAWSRKYPVSGLLGRLPLYDDHSGTIYTIDNSVTVPDKLGLLLKSTNGGDTWQPDTTGLSTVGGSVFFVDEKGGQHIGNSFYGNSFNNAAWAKAKGGAWVIDTTGLPTGNYSYTNGFASDGKGYLYITGYFSGKKIMRRPVAGGAWVIDTAGIPSTVSYLDKFSGGAGDVVGLSGGKLYHRGAGKWSAIPLPSSLTFPVINAVSIDSSSYVFAALTVSGKGSGVYFTSDLGLHWKYTGLDSADVASLVAYGDTTYVLTRNMGAYLLTHNSALPVALSIIKAYQFGKGIQVEWSGYNEINMSSYMVERSANGNQFLPLGSITAKNNNAPANTYTYFDAAPYSGDNYYRVKAISKNGNTQYSGIVKVTVQNGKDGMLVYPNPAVNKTINIQMNNIPAGRYFLVVYNAAGQRVYTAGFMYAGASASVTVNAQNMSHGVYWVVLQGKGHVYNSSVLVK